MTRQARAFLLVALLAAPGSAYAHSPIKGINNFYNGFLHPVFVPAHLLLLIAIGLFFGQQGPRENQAALLTFIGATVVGLAGAWFSVAGQVEVVILTVALTVGVLIAISPRLSWYWCSVVGAVAGFILGLDSAQETLFGTARLVALSGSAVGICFFSIYPMGLADYFKNKPWQKIGIRVIGSWVAASSLLVLALSFSSVKF